MKPLLILAPTICFSLTGCLEGDDSSSNNKVGECDSNNPNLVVQTAQWEDGQYASAVAIGCSRDASLTDRFLVQARESDFRVSTADDGFYHIGRDGISTISKHNYENPSLSTLGYSTNDPQSGNSNPYAVVQTSTDKAYVLRYAKSEAWIINPEAKSADEFKVGTIDLGSYVYAGAPDEEQATNMSVAQVIGNKLFIGIQHLYNGTSYVYDEPSDIAVIDITTNTEIDTTPNNTSDEKSIQLTGINITALDAHKGFLFAASRGNYATEYGHLEKIDADSFEVTTLVQGDASTGHIIDVAIVSDSLGYFVGSPSWGTATLFSFNPSIPSVWTKVDDYADINLTDIESDLDGNLWIGVKNSSDGHGVYKYDPTGTAETTFLQTTYPPVQIAFKPI